MRVIFRNLTVKIFGIYVDIYPYRVYNVVKIPVGGIIVNKKLQDINSKACACHKTKKRDEAEYKKLVNRLNRIEGQIRGIKRMLENDAYCPDILVQAAAVNAAINSFNKELLSSHIHTCVADDIREGKDEVIDELMDTLQKLMR